MTEPKIHVSTGFGGGISVNLRADTGAELESLIQGAAATSPTLARLMQLTGITAATDQGAVQNVQQAFPQAQVVSQPVSTVGQPLPQPGVVAQPAAAPPTLVNPGPCAHGARVYKDSQARGRAWRRWECAVPWSKGVQGRCEPINVEG
jgi:hypothetical protein